MKVSVCLPCYNCAPYIGASLDSILSQSWRDLEIVVCDDGSTDGSLDIISSYADSKVRLIQQANCGAAVARNRAFDASSGELVIFMDSDDLISPNHIAALVEKIESDNGIAFAQWDRFYSNPNEAVFPDRPTYHFTDGVEFLIHGGWDMLQCAMFLLPRALVLRHGAWNPARSPIDDFEFYTRIISRTRILRFAPEARVFYRSGLQGSLSTKRSDLYLQGKFSSLLLGSKWLLEAEDSPRTRRACADLFKAFEYAHYPDRPDLRIAARQRVQELGGSDLQPSGPPGFHRLRRYTGWKIARRIQNSATNLGLNAVSRRVGSRT